MPTKRRFIIFLIVLTLMLLIKRAVSQETMADVRRVPKIKVQMHLV